MGDYTGLEYSGYRLRCPRCLKFRYQLNLVRAFGVTTLMCTTCERVRPKRARDPEPKSPGARFPEMRDTPRIEAEQASSIKASRVPHFEGEVP